MAETERGSSPSTRLIDTNALPPPGSTMRVLVTGAEGFIGSHLAELLVSEGHEVVCAYFDEPSLWRLEDVRGTARMVYMDVRDPARVDRVVASSKPEVVYHLAAQSLPALSWQEPALTMETNVMGTVHLFETVRHYEPDASILVACSSAEYGIVDAKHVPTKEDNPLRPLHPYGVSKVAQDLLAYQYFHNFGMRAYRARIYNTTGTRKVGDVLADFTSRVVDIEKGRSQSRLRVGNLDPRRDITDVRDMVIALSKLVEKGRPGEAYNICSGRVVSMGELLELVLAQSEAKVEVFQDPELIRPSDEPVIAGDNRKFVKDTGWKPIVPLEKTVKDMLAFWRKYEG